MGNEKLLAGYARLDITPKEPVPLAGYGGTMHRISNNIMDPLYATAICVTGTNGETVFFVPVDALLTAQMLSDRIRRNVHEKLGTGIDSVFVAATHSHSTPDLFAKTPVIERYDAFYVEQITEACIEAYEDRKPATLYHGGKVTAGLNFVRHLRMEDGTYAGSNFGDFKKRAVAFAAEPDHRLRLIQFRRETGKDILLVNFQAHPCCTGGMRFYNVSADYIGVVRPIVEAATGCDFAYFLGAAGNVNMVSWWRATKIFDMYDNEPYGKAVADEVLKALPTLRPIEGTEVHLRARDHVAIRDHSDDCRLDVAQKICDYYNETYDRVTANKMSQEAGMNSVYAALAIVGRSKEGPSETIHFGAATVGDVGFVGAPYEMFSQSGYAIRDKSPMGETVIMSCCNGYKGYLASEEAFEHGCYEVDARKYVKGTAEAMVAHYLEMLKEMKDQGV